MIVRVFIGMKLYSQFAVGSFYVLITGITADAEHLIIVAFTSHEVVGPLETITLAGRIRRSLSLKPLRS